MDLRTILKEKGGDIAMVRPDNSISEAASVMRERRVGALVVSKDRQSLDGIISERDLVRGLATHGAALLDMPVSELMTREVRTCKPDASIQETMGEMTRHRFRHLPVTEDGKLVGIISIGDIVKNRLEELENETSALREYIVGAN